MEEYTAWLELKTISEEELKGRKGQYYWYKCIKRTLKDACAAEYKICDPPWEIPI